MIFTDLSHESTRILYSGFSYFLFVIFVYLFCNSILSKQLTIYIVALSAFLSLSVFVPRDLSFQIIHSSDSSNILWSISLQSPSHYIKRLLPYPRYVSPHFRLSVKLSNEYSGKSALFASINGGDFLRLSAAGLTPSFKYPSPDYYVHELQFASDDYPLGLPILVLINQPIPDQRLRISVWGDTSGATYKKSSTWFGYESLWFAGVPHAQTGMITDGFPIIWIENVE